MDNFESTYRINVAKLDNNVKSRISYKHYFAVDVISRENAIDVLTDLNKFYLYPEYDVDVTFWNISGKIVHSKECKINMTD